MEKENSRNVMYKNEFDVIIDVSENKKMAAGELIDFLSVR